jgi:hypothetical protein
MLQYSFVVEWNDPGIGDLVERFLGPFHHDEAGHPPVYTLNRAANDRGVVGYTNGRRFHEGISVGALLNRFLRRVNAEVIRTATDVLLAHAGAVSWEDRGMLLPAAMNAGKTTLVGGLIRAGFAYLTDEAAPIDPATSWVHPYPKPLAVDRRSLEALGGLPGSLARAYTPGELIQYHLSPSDLRERPIGEPCPVRFVVAPKYETGDRTRLDPINRATALAILAENSFNLDRFGSRGLSILGRAVEGAECFRLRFGDIDAAVGLIADLVQGRTRDDRTRAVADARA